MPCLEFNDISFGVAHVAERQASSAWNVEGYDFTVIVSACSENFGAFFWNIGNFKCDVRKTGARDIGRWSCFAGFVFEYFECWAVFAVARQTQMASARACSRTRGQRFEFCAIMIAFAADRNALEDTFVEIGEPFPIARDQVRVGEANRGLQEAI